MSHHETGVGGFKEVIFQVRGRGAFSRLKYESGVHRVQRVPVTEAQGRIHTSTATVAVCRGRQVDIQVAHEDVRIDVFRRRGRWAERQHDRFGGARHASATGLVVSCQTRSRSCRIAAGDGDPPRPALPDEQERLAAERSDAASQVGTGERSEKIRTYNFPQNRVTDHRIGKTIYNLPSVFPESWTNSSKSWPRPNRLRRLNDRRRGVSWRLHNRRSSLPPKLRRRSRQRERHPCGEGEWDSATDG